jgi:hypothetical protein
MHLFYSITEFIEWKIDEGNILSTELLLWLRASEVNAFILITRWFCNQSFEMFQISLE